VKVSSPVTVFATAMLVSVATPLVAHAELLLNDEVVTWW